jgi:hypothetical protein
MPDEKDRELQITPAAQRVIAAMRDRVSTIELQYGDGSPEHVEALKSLAHAYGSMLRLGGRIMMEGRPDELCLLGVTDIAPSVPFTYGVDFLPKRHGEQRDPLLGEWYVHS